MRYRRVPLLAMLIAVAVVGCSLNRRGGNADGGSDAAQHDAMAMDARDVGGDLGRDAISADGSMEAALDSVAEGGDGDAEMMDVNALDAADAMQTPDGDNQNDGTVDDSSAESDASDTQTEDAHSEDVQTADAEFDDAEMSDAP